jgi:hypothetical protein
MLVGCASLFLVGLTRFLRADATFEVTLPRVTTSPATTAETNLVALATGPILRASSFDRDVYGFAHPAYLVDGRDAPSAGEKWTPRFDDAAPWIELGFREPRHVRRVVVRHGKRPNRAYHIRCLGDGAPVLEVKRNKASVASHELDCPRASGVRIDFTKSRGKAPVVYEVEVFGR